MLHAVHTGKLTPAEKRVQWSSLLDELKQSNMTQKQFCEIKGLKLHMLTYYLKQHRKKDSTNNVQKFVPIEIKPEVNHAYYKLKISNIIELDVPSHLPPNQIAELISHIRMSLC